MSEFLEHPVFLRAVVLGALGGIGLVLTTLFSRRGPLIFPVYAAFLSSVAVLLAQYTGISFSFALSAAMAGFAVASGLHYVAVVIIANRQRRQRGYHQYIPLFGHAWRLAALFTMGLIASSGVAFVAS